MTQPNLTEAINDSVELDTAIAEAWEACKDMRDAASKRQIFELGFLRGRVCGSKETGDLALTTLRSAFGTHKTLERRKESK